MQRAAALDRNDSAKVKLDKLDALLAQTSTSKQDAALLADILSLPNDERYPSLRYDIRAAAAADIRITPVTSGGNVALHTCADDL
jgi:hypothetical protein